MIDLRQGISQVGYVLLTLWVALFVVLVGHVWWDDPERLSYITLDIWVDIFTVMLAFRSPCFCSGGCLSDLSARKIEACQAAANVSKGVRE
jgi:hypothetical protein